MALSDLERRIVAVIEESWMAHARLVPPRNIAERFGIPESQASKILTSENVRAAFKDRGIPEIEGAGLSPEQVTAINVVVNPIDTRSRTKKLRDMNISAAMWAGWMKNTAFNEFLRKRSSDLLTDAIPEAHMALVDNVMRGDFQSIKFLYEMTGHYDSNKTGVDIPALLNKVFEIISLYIQDQETLLRIAEGLGALAGPSTIMTRTQQPELTQGEVIATSPVAAVDKDFEDIFKEM
jgi:hypothetical protein